MSDDVPRRLVDQRLGNRIAACDATPRDVTTAQLIATGWPPRIADEARAALTLML